MESTIRPARAGDAPEIARIFNQYVARATMVLVPRAPQDYLPLLSGERTVCFVSERADGPLSGFAYAKPYSERGGYCLAGEVTIFLDEDATGGGLGGLLYEQLLPAAHALGYRHLTAKIWADNSGSIRFHQRFGFRLLGTQVGIGFVHGRRVDAVLLERVWET